MREQVERRGSRKSEREWLGNRRDAKTLAVLPVGGVLALPTGALAILQSIDLYAYIHTFYIEIKLM